MLATREAMRGLCAVEVVAFPQSGLLVRRGTLELLDAALRMGADAVGGLDPCAIDRDPKGHLDAVFGLAERHGKPVDIHLHEPGELGLFTMELIVGAPARSAWAGVWWSATLSASAIPTRRWWTRRWTPWRRRAWRS